jgi:predicted NAD/FAD-dependent oxidoreductase
VIGAGAAAAAAAFELSAAGVDADVTVLEKSGGLCGRAATRRHGELTYDYGANYVTSDDERVTRLLTERLDDDGLVDISEPTYTFDADGEVSPGREPDGHRWSYEAGLTQIAKRLFAQSDATVHRRTRVETIHRDGDRWRLTDGDGEQWGPFDFLLVNPPAPQTTALWETAEWDDPRRTALADAVGEVTYRTVWTAVLRYDFRLDVPYYGLVDTDKRHPVGWLSREECKAGHVPDGETLLIVQGGGQWSREHYDREPSENVAALADHAAEIVGDDRLREPTWTDHQGWRYALPEGGVDTEALTAAAEAGVYHLGDWVAGEARLHAALRSGLETGERLVESL